jgi:hypothetical protein
MSNVNIRSIPMDEKECHQDAMRRLNSWLAVLEGRISALLSENDPASMKPNEREQAASRYLLLTLRVLQLRNQYAEASPSPGEQALLDVLLRGMDDEPQ